MHSIRSGSRVARHTQAVSSLPDGKRETITRPRERVMTGRARNVPVSTQDLVEEEKVPQFDLRRCRCTVVMKITITNRRRKVATSAWMPEERRSTPIVRGPARVPAEGMLDGAEEDEGEGSKDGEFQM